MYGTLTAVVTNGREPGVTGMKLSAHVHFEHDKLDNSISPN